MKSEILVTGGAGYIGSHVCVELCRAGFSPFVLDSFTNSRFDVVSRIERITGQPIAWQRIDLRDRRAISELIENHRFEAIIHLAGLKGIFESQHDPLNYYHVNVFGLINILKQLKKGSSVKAIIYSSSASVYSELDGPPYQENSPTSGRHPYGRTKLICEQILKDIFNVNSEISTGILRYFNPAGADKSGLIGDSSQAKPQSLFTSMSQCANRKEGVLNIYGADYPTPDGTALRDYIHISDLALGHIHALKAALSGRKFFLSNLGTGAPVSVCEAVQAYSAASGCDIATAFVSRRDGDLAAAYADVAHAEEVLGFRATRSLLQICETDWAWRCFERANL